MKVGVKKQSLAIFLMAPPFCSTMHPLPRPSCSQNPSSRTAFPLCSMDNGTCYRCFWITYQTTIKSIREPYQTGQKGCRGQRNSCNVANFGVFQKRPQGFCWYWQRVYSTGTERPWLSTLPPFCHRTQCAYYFLLQFYKHWVRLNKIHLPVGKAPDPHRTSRVILLEGGHPYVEGGSDWSKS